MKRVIVITLLIVTGTLLATAQTTGKGKSATKARTENTGTKQSDSKPKKEAAKPKLTPAQKTVEVIAKMKAACNLNPEQVTKIEAAYLEYYQKHDALKKQKEILSKTVYEEREGALKKTRNAVIKATLTAAQYKQWQTAKGKDTKAKAKDGDKKESDEE
ncbi:MAG TPA: hypothetical protein PLW44_04880 [Chitinophagales bacterium]|nr:hypothetical protein [Chitinophagales bacterium]